MTYTVTLNGVASSTITGFTVLRVKRPGLGETRTVYEVVPGVEGSWNWQEQKGDVALVLSCAVEVTDFTTRRDKVREVMKWADVGFDATLVIDDKPTRYFFGELSEAPPIEEMRSLGVFDLTFRVRPYQFDNSITSTIITATASPEPFSGTIVTDTGDVNTKPIIEVKALAALTAGFALTLNGLQLVYPVAMATNEIITINSINSTVQSNANYDTELTGVFDPALLAMTDVAGLFPTLKDGSNAYSLGRRGAPANTQITIYWRKRWLP